MQNPSFNFTRATTRAPAKSVVDGLRAVDSGTPNYLQMQKDHIQYVNALQEAGLVVTKLPALQEFPDAQFVEDTALCLPQGAILMRPGAPSRLGEVSAMRPNLKTHSEVFEIKSGHIEGGDILTTNTEILIGLSDRTNMAGYEELQNLVKNWGYALRIVQTPPGVLHFKTDCSLLDGETILSTKRLDDSGCFEGYNVIHTADGEDAAANAIRVNGLVLMAAGFPDTAEKLRVAGYDIREINNSECAKIDGGMSCLSLRF